MPCVDSTLFTVSERRSNRMAPESGRCCPQPSCISVHPYLYTGSSASSMFGRNGQQKDQRLRQVVSGIGACTAVCFFIFSSLGPIRPLFCDFAPLTFIKTRIILYYRLCRADTEPSHVLILSCIQGCTRFCIDHGPVFLQEFPPALPPRSRGTWSSAEI